MFNVAVVGCGYWGPNLIRNFSSLSDCSVKKICDSSSERLAHIKKLYRDAETTTKFEDVLADPHIDAVALATPIRSHFEMGTKSLEAGKHTFIEKPMACSTAECKQLIKTAEKHRLVLAVGHTFIYSTPVRKIKEIVDAGDLGQIQYISSRRLNLGLFQTDINVAWDLAPHDISVILYIMGKQPISVNCQGKANVNPNVEDVTNIILNFSGGGFATIQSSWLDPNKIRETTFVGTKKMLVYNDIEPIEKIKIYDKHVEMPPHYDTFAEFQYAYHYGDMYSPYLEMVEPLKVECRHFLDCINGSAKPLTGGLEGLQVVQILEAASQSLKKNGGEVKIVY